MKKSRPLLHHLRTLLNSVPSKNDKNVDWETLEELKRVAGMSLDELSKIVGGDDNTEKTKKCNPTKPQEEPPRGPCQSFLSKKK